MIAFLFLMQDLSSSYSLFYFMLKHGVKGKNINDALKRTNIKHPPATAYVSTCIV